MEKDDLYTIMHGDSGGTAVGPVGVPILDTDV